MQQERIKCHVFKFGPAMSNKTQTLVRCNTQSIVWCKQLWLWLLGYGDILHNNAELFIHSLVRYRTHQSSMYQNQHNRGTCISLWQTTMSCKWPLINYAIATRSNYGNIPIGCMAATELELWYWTKGTYHCSPSGYILLAILIRNVSRSINPACTHLHFIINILCKWPLINHAM